MLSTTRAANSYEWSAARSWMSQSCSNDRYGLQCSKCTHLIEAGLIGCRVASLRCDCSNVQFLYSTRPAVAEGVSMLLYRAWLGLPCNRLPGFSQHCFWAFPAARQVQSTDKNFMVPVGGAIVAGPSSALVDKARTLLRAAGKHCTTS